MEGSVVRLSDVIGYIGRDIEDAITLGVVVRTDIPENPRRVIGDTNSKIVDTLIKDVIINSLGKPYLSFSKDIFEALIELKQWNYEKIYNSEKAKEELQKNTITNSERVLYHFVDKMMEKPDEDIKRVIVDYIAGQTDKYFLNECELYLE